MDEHPVTVDVGGLEAQGLRYPEPTSIEGQQDYPVPTVGDGLKVIGFAVLGAAVVLVLGRMLN